MDGRPRGRQPVGHRDGPRRRVQQHARPPHVRSRAREPPFLVAAWLAAGQVQQQVGRQSGHVARGSAVLRDGRTARAHDRRRGGLRAGALVPGWCAGHDAVFAGSSGAARPVVWSHGWVRAAGHDRGLRAAVARGSVAPRELRFRGHDRVPALRVRHGGCGNGRRACALPSARAVQLVRPARGRGHLAAAAHRRVGGTPCVGISVRSGGGRPGAECAAGRPLAAWVRGAASGVERRPHRGGSGLGSSGGCVHRREPESPSADLDSPRRGCATPPRQARRRVRPVGHPERPARLRHP